jgi:hypothetical protein
MLTAAWKVIVPERSVPIVLYADMTKSCETRTMKPADCKRWIASRRSSPTGSSYWPSNTSHDAPLVSAPLEKSYVSIGRNPAACASSMRFAAIAPIVESVQTHVPSLVAREPVASMIASSRTAAPPRPWRVRSSPPSSSGDTSSSPPSSRKKPNTGLAVEFR